MGRHARAPTPGTPGKFPDPRGKTFIVGECSVIFGPWQTMPELPDQWDSIELADEQHPFRLVTSPARSFLNSTFNETDSSKKKEGRPEVWLRPEEAEVENMEQLPTIPTRHAGRCKKDMRCPGMTNIRT